jgi:hypothetical protein
VHLYCQLYQSKDTYRLVSLDQPETVSHAYICIQASSCYCDVSNACSSGFSFTQITSVCWVPTRDTTLRVLEHVVSEGREGVSDRVLHGQPCFENFRSYLTSLASKLFAWDISPVLLRVVGVVRVIPM